MNTFFEWSKEFETGFETIDSQHYELVKIINNLMKLTLSYDANKIDQLESTKKMLSEYMITHFQTEEDLMNEYSIDPGFIKSHVDLHNEFIEHVQDYSLDSSDLSKKIAEEMIEYLIRWLAYHILNVDKSLFRQIRRIRDNKITPSEAYESEQNVFNCPTEPLIKALRALYSLVTEKNKELEDKNNQLEETVKQRTEELTKANDLLKNLSLVDALTGSFNRRFAVNALDQLLYNWNRYKTPYSIVYLDLDKFKSVNDKYGHEKGDLVLKWVAEFLKSNVRKTDSVCRIGGDEFIIICIHYSVIDIEKLGQKLLKRLSMEVDSGSTICKYWSPSFSIGISTMNDAIASSEELLTKADNAMYISKQRGGNSLTMAE